MIKRSALHSAVRGAVRSPFERRAGGAAAFDFASLYSGGKKGIWADPSDYASLKQDVLGATPVTAAGQSAAVQLDKARGLAFVPITDAVWQKTAGDGVVSVVGNTVTVTGATTATTITRVSGTIPAVPGRVRLRVTATFAGATGVQFWTRAAPVGLSSGVQGTNEIHTTNATLERLDVGSGSVTFVINEFSQYFGNFFFQPTATARPISAESGAVKSLTFDGVDDGVSTQPFAAGTLTANMDCFIAVKRNSAANAILASQGTSGANLFGAMVSGDGTAPHGGCGTPTYFVNGVSVASTRGALHTAVTVGDWKIVEVRNLDLSAWTAMAVGNYASFLLNGEHGGFVLCEAQTDTERAKIRTALGAKVGVVL